VPTIIEMVHGRGSIDPRSRAYMRQAVANACGRRAPHRLPEETDRSASHRSVLADMAIESGPNR